MQIRISTLGLITLLASFSVDGQGTFFYDQQSSTDETSTPSGMVVLPVSPGSGDSQSFTPTLSSIGFIRLLFVTGAGSANCYLNIRSDSIAGPIIGTSGSVSANVFGPQTFLFNTPVSVTAGTSYYFEAVEQTGTPWNVGVGQYNYSGGSAFYSGTLQGSVDYWFREGVVVPEPSPAVLLLFGFGTLFYFRRQWGM